MKERKRKKEEEKEKSTANWAAGRWRRPSRPNMTLMVVSFSGPG
jgi:hypothetical protein